MKKLFAVSVADALLLDPKTDNLLVKGKALLSSSMEQTIQEQEVYAGRGSQLQTVYNYQKVVAFQLEAADFNPTYLALQTGSEIKNKLSKYYTEETVEFDANGKGTLKKVPIGNVYVEMDAGNQTIVPNDKEITIPTLADKTAMVVYQYETLVDEMVIPANSFPKACKLVLTSGLFDEDGDHAYEVQIEVPRYKLDGAMSLSLTHDGTSQSTLNGKSLVDDKSNYAYIKYLPMGDQKVEISMLASNPSEVVLDSAITNDSEQVTVYGIRGGGYGNIVMDNTKLTFTSDDPTIATVDTKGKITAVSVGNTTVRVTDGKYKEVIDVEVI